MFTRVRLLRTNGNAANQIHWWENVPVAVARPTAVVNLKVFNLMDRWLTAIEADQSDIAHEVKVTRNKPLALFDACINNGLMYEWRAGSVCEMLFFYTGLSRMVAGGPNTDDVLKCQLKPLNRADYSVTFTDAQWARIQQTFSSGVCDFSKPGVGQQPPTAPWLTFSSGPGGTPLGPPPTSH